MDASSSSSKPATARIKVSESDTIKWKELDVSLTEFDKERLEDVGFMNAMMLVLLGNYAQTGHFGGPLSYTPATVVTHLAGPENGGLRYDIRNPKAPLTDKFMLAGGHCIPVCYALWMILYEAMARQHKATGDDKFACDPEVAILPIDALGFRRTPGATATLLEDAGLSHEDPLFAQAKLRGIRALMGHSETTDVTNDVNGGPSGIGVAGSAGRALFWDFVGASPDEVKVITFEGEFAFTEGHSQELKTLALSAKLGKRLRLFFSYNNAGIDDKLVGGVIDEKYADVYNMAQQFTSYGWNVFEIPDGADYAQLCGVFQTMENWPEDDRRPMVVIAHTIKGWWPVEVEDQIVSFKSHPYNHARNSSYFLRLAESFERRFGVTFHGIRDGPCEGGEQGRLVQFKRNVDVLMSVLEGRDGLGAWIANRLVRIADTLPKELSACRMDTHTNPFKDERLLVKNLPMERQTISITHPTSGEKKDVTIDLFLSPGTKKGTRRAISEVGKWLNYISGNRFLTIAADLSGSINVENANLTGHYDPETNPHGTRLKAGIQECVNAATICGLASQTLSTDPSEHVGVWGVSGTYGAFTPLMYLPCRIFSQQNQDSPFNLGVVTIIAGHSGPETAADARSHFGVFSPQCWKLFPRGQVINLYFWDYNDVAPGYFAAIEAANAKKETGIIVIHVARPDFHVVDRTTFHHKDTKAAARGAYIIREYQEGKPKHGTVLVQGSSSTVNLVSVIPRLEEDDINVRIVAVISEDLLRLQSKEYQEEILAPHHKYDCMVITTGTKRCLPLEDLGPLTLEYTMSSDHDDRWRSGGLEGDVIREAKLDAESIFQGVKRFAEDREERLARQFSAMNLLK